MYHSGEPSYTVDGDVNWYSNYGEEYGDSLKKQQSHSWTYIQRKPQFKKIHEPQCSHCSTIYNSQDMEAT